MKRKIKSQIIFQSLSAIDSLISVLLFFLLKGLPLIIAAYSKLYIDNHYDSTKWSWSIATIIFLVSFFIIGYLIKLLEKPLKHFSNHIEELKSKL